MNTDVAFIDTETTGLQADRCPIWEVAVIVDGIEHVWTQRLPLWATEDNTDYDIWTPEGETLGLPINDGLDTDESFVSSGLPIINEWPIEHTGINARYRHAEALDPADSIRRFAELTEGRFLVGANPAFDDQRLRRVYRAYVDAGEPPWHYRLLDIHSIALAAANHRWNAGHLWDGNVRAPKPGPMMTGRALSEMLGVTYPTGPDRHTALGDARWVAALYNEVMR